jgi:hypothetical protein
MFSTNQNNPNAREWLNLPTGYERLQRGLKLGLVDTHPTERCLEVQMSGLFDFIWLSEDIFVGYDG